MITPVKTFSELPESSVWQPAYRTLYELIRSHKTTLVFAGMRAQTEKIARALNQLNRQITGDPSAKLALAHHGSISRDARHNIEARLKSGNIPAVIATASLELGIDIGSIDLVVQLEAPRSVTGALQRVGRSGHLLSAASKGRIIVLYPADLDDAVAIATCMVKADIEETRIPENALDVLAQQIVAEVAVKNWDYEDLYRLIRGSYCYRQLPSSAFRSVVEMLCGKYADISLQALNSRLNWDRVNNCLITRRGSRLAALLNGGTIPDRGYYGVYLQNTNVRLGEVEEEFAFESRVGEVFFLGNSEWQIKQILQDRIIVSPVAAINPRAPFWKGGILHRDYSTSKKIGQFRRKLLDQIDLGQARSWLTQRCLADENTAQNLTDYFSRQSRRGHQIATDKRVVAEVTADSGGQPLLILHAPFGARVNGAWAIAFSAALEQYYQTQFQYSFDDDGILIRLPETAKPPPLKNILKYSASKIEAFLIKALPQSPIFLVHFRHNAARSLILPRSHPGKRIPLWLQRLRASDLLQATSKYNDFPIIIETYRECLRDVLDLDALKKVISGIESGRILVNFVNTSIPSPMAAGILFKFVSVHLYEEDHRRQPGEGLTVARDILEDMLDHRRVPALLTLEIVDQAEKRWQHLDPFFQAASAEDLFNIIEKLAPITAEDLIPRCKADPAQWLDELNKTNRIIMTGPAAKKDSSRLGSKIEIKPAIPDGSRPENVAQRIQRYLQSRGPVTLGKIVSDLALPPALVSKTLGRMLRAKQVVNGHLIKGLDEERWCDRYNFTRLYRATMARRRAVRQPADRRTFTRFLIQWHGLAKPGQSMPEVLKRYRGYRFPLYFFEREILGSRYYIAGSPHPEDRLAEFDSRISNGEIIVHSGRNGKTGRRYVEFRMRGEGSLFSEQQVLLDTVNTLSSAAGLVFNFLQENGASYGRDLEAGVDLSHAELHRALKELVEKGLASCENYQAFLITFQSRQSNSPPNQGIRHSLPLSSKPKGLSFGRYRRYRSRSSSRADLRKMLQHKRQIQDGRWFLTTSFAVMGKRIEDSQRVERQARLLLQRYGILIKEWYRREQGLLNWHPLFQVLKRLEWQGEIRRGYFVSGLSGVQFALPEALDLLDRMNRNAGTGDSDPIVVSSLDPALPFGGAVSWGLNDSRDKPLKLMRSASNHLLLVNGEIVMVAERFFQQLSILKEMSPNSWELLTNRLQEYLKLPPPIKPTNRIEIHRINNLAAATSPVATHLLKAGFEMDGSRLVLWPSAAR